MEYILSSVLFCVGLYAVMVKKNILKTIIGIAVMGYSVNLFFILSGFRFYAEAPILSNNTGPQPLMTVDPLAQAMVLATVALGMAVTFVLTALALKLFDKYQTFDITEIKKLKG
jgi:multicomponent Na+:H+ antiporter subunit C